MLVIEIDPTASKVSQVFVRARNEKEEDLSLRAWQTVRPLVDCIDLTLKQSLGNDQTKAG